MLKIKHWFKRVGRAFSNLSFKIYRKTFMASGTRNVIVLVLVFALGFGVYAYFYWDETFKQFIGTLVGVLTAVFIGAITHLVSVAFEDRNKVTEDYKLIKETYTKEDLRQHLNFMDGTHIEFAYKGRANIIKSIEVEDDNDKFYNPTDVMSSNYVKLFNAHRGSFKKNVHTVRIDDVKEENDSLKIQTSRSTYFNHLVSNRVMDFPFAKSLTLRSLYEPGPDITPLRNSVFSNHLGIIGIIKTTDNFYILNKRSKTGSTSKDLLVTPVAFGLTAGVKEKVTSDYITERVKFKANERLKESKEDHTDYVTNIIQVGYGRDLYEAGKPHFFYLIEISLSKDEYLQRFYNKNCTKHIIDYNSKAIAIKASEFGFNKGFFHIKHYHYNNKIKNYFMQAETNLVMNIKCLADLDLFK